MPVTPLKLDGMRDAAAAVAAGGEGAEAGSEGRRRAAAAAAGGVVGVPRVAAGFADEVLGGAGLAEFGACWSCPG